MTRRITCLDVIANQQGFSRYFGWVQVNKLVHDNKVRVANWNMDILTRESIKFSLHYDLGGVNIVCLQEN